MRKMHILRITTPIKYRKTGVYIILLSFGINFRIRSVFDCVLFVVYLLCFTHYQALYAG